MALADTGCNMAHRIQLPHDCYMPSALLKLSPSLLPLLLSVLLLLPLPPLPRLMNPLLLLLLSRLLPPVMLLLPLPLL